MKGTAQKISAPGPGKFQDLQVCADGAERAHQAFRGWSELWIFTGTRCNLSCEGCYTESTPRNDSFRFLSHDQAEWFLREARELGIPKICYTGGEPFFNPDFPAILETTLELGFQCLVLTNLTTPFEARGKDRVLHCLRNDAPLQIRVSLDHPDPHIHEEQVLDPRILRRYPTPPGWNGDREYWFDTGFNRGRGNFQRTLTNLRELHRAGGRISVAGRGPGGVGGKLFQAYVEETIPRFQKTFQRNGIPTDLALKIFPDIGKRTDRNVPEITQYRCRTLIPEPVFDALMCNEIRMVAVPSTWQGKENSTPFVFPCTIVPDNPLMVLGKTLKEAVDQETYLADSRCYRFCIAGGASCSET